MDEGGVKRPGNVAIEMETIRPREDGSESTAARAASKLAAEMPDSSIVDVSAPTAEPPAKASAEAEAKAEGTSRDFRFDFSAESFARVKSCLGPEKIPDNISVGAEKAFQVIGTMLDPSEIFTDAQLKEKKGELTKLRGTVAAEQSEAEAWHGPGASWLGSFVSRWTPEQKRQYNSFRSHDGTDGNPPGRFDVQTIDNALGQIAIALSDSKR